MCIRDRNSIRLKELKPGDLRIDAPAGRDAARVRIITVIDRTVATVLEQDELKARDLSLIHI